ncbi:receptor activity-modifying protein 2 [Latimeria chalumnae]|uniref:receptor activity-modifying protein 2 n=1 Tax=Latimeria chalumnae TaxID=7897 RepID=UPI00313DCC1A
MMAPFSRTMLCIFLSISLLVWGVTTDPHLDKNNTSEVDRTVLDITTDPHVEGTTANPMGYGAEAGAGTYITAGAAKRCQKIYKLYISNYCEKSFHTSMFNLSMEDWCDWNQVGRHYSNLTHCIEAIAGFISCYYPDQISEELFIRIHTTFFRNCSLNDNVYSDPPENTLMALVLTPVCIIPLMVALVVWKSKNDEPKS